MNRPLILFFSLVISGIAGEIQYTVSFRKDDLSFTKLKGYDIVRLKGYGFTEEVGAPLLPKATLRILIPPGSEIVNIEVISKEQEILPGEYLIYPKQPPRPIILSHKPPPWVEPNKEIYSKALPYPLKIAEPSHTGNMGGYRIGGISLYPLQYIPAEKRLIFYSKLKLRITYKEKVYPVFPRTSGQRNLFKNIVKKLVVNPEYIEEWSPPLRSRSRSLQLPPDTVEYVVITSSSLASAFQPLIDWKTKKGVPARVVTLDFIYAHYSGVDSAERIRNFIIDANLNWGTNWVLLGGQCDFENLQEIVPRRDVYYLSSGVGYYPDEDTIPSDLYYSDLDGNWNFDGDGVWGEREDSVDLYSDVFVGRAPCLTVSDVTRFVNKVLTYEKNPPLGYQPKMLLPASYLFPGYDETQSQEVIANITPAYWQDSRLYEQYGNLSRRAVIDSLNSGFGLIHHVSHGNAYGVSYLSSSDVDTLSNDNMLGIHNGISCMTGAVDYVSGGDCFAEHFLTAPYAGVATIMNSRYGWGDPPSMGPSEVIDTSFYYQIFLGEYASHYRLGVAHAVSKDAHVAGISWFGIWPWCIYELNLFGDPEMPVWTDIPDTMVVSHPPVISLGTHNFTVTVQNRMGEPIEDALVCLMEDTLVYERGYTDATGSVTLTVSPPMPGTLWVTTTAHNYLPYEGYALCISEGPYVGYQKHLIDDDTIGGSSGDGDGMVEPGETIELSLWVENYGNQPASGVEGIISTNDPFITITDSLKSYGDIASRDSAESPSPYIFTVDPSAPDQHWVTFDLSCRDILDSLWVSHFNILVGYFSRVSGYVKETAGDTGIPGAIVTYFGPTFGSDTTDSNGYYEVSGLPSGSYTFIASAEGFFPETVYVSLPPDTSIDFILKVPEIEVIPETLGVSLDITDTTSQIMKIYNRGTDTLTFNIGESSLQSPLLIKSLRHPTKKVLSVSKLDNPKELKEGILRLKRGKVSSKRATPLAGNYVGDHLAFGLTDYGEVIPFQSPIGAIHIFDYSGYTICYNDGTDHIEWAGYGDREGITPISYTEVANDADKAIIDVVTQTSGGQLEISQRFTFDKHDRFVSVNTKVRNITSTLLGDVVFKIWADWDMDNDSPDDDWDYDSTHNMVYASDIHYGAIGGAKPPDYRDIRGWDDFYRRETDEDYPDGPKKDYDGLEILHYELGSISPGEEKTLSFAYGAGDDLSELQAVMERGIDAVIWLSKSPAKGRVPPGDSVEVVVSYDPSSLEPDSTYKGWLKINSNDPDEPTVSVLCSLNVTANYYVEVTPKYQDSTGFIGDTLWYRLDIRNRGENTDSYDLTASGNNWSTTFWDSTGTSQITNTGNVSPGSSVGIIVKINIPEGISNGEIDTVSISVTSNANPNISDEAYIKTMGVVMYSIPFEDGFEEGLDKWLLSGTNNWAIYTGTGQYGTGGAYEGDSVMVMTCSLCVDYSTSYADLYLKLSGERDVVIDYYWRTWSLSGLEGVWLDIYDGEWHLGVDSLTGEDTDWQHVHLDLSGYNMIDGFIVRFRGYMDCEEAYDAVYIDKVRVYTPEFGSVAGTVKDAATSSPIQDAVVEVKGSGLSDTTDAFGNYQIDNIEVGIYDIVCNASGYLPKTAHNISIIPNDTITVDFSMTRPDIEVTPDSLGVVLAPDDTSSQIMRIKNKGNDTLTFNIRESSSPFYLKAVALQSRSPKSLLHTQKRIGKFDKQLSIVSLKKNTLKVKGNNQIPTGALHPLAGTYTGDYLHFGLTDYGEIMPFQYPVGTDHLPYYLSGYTVCYNNGMDHIEWAGYGSREGIIPVSYTEVVNDVNRAIIDVVTQTSGGELEISQRFTFDKHDKFIRIDTKIKNISGTDLTDVAFKTYADWDMDGYILNNWDYNSTHNMIYAYNIHYGAIGGAKPPDYRDINGWDDYYRRETDEDYPDGPVNDFDGLEILHYELGSLLSGEEKSLCFAYGAGDDLSDLQAVIERAIDAIKWLSENPTSGKIPPGDSIDIIVSYNSSDLARFYL